MRDAKANMANSIEALQLETYDNADPKVFGEGPMQEALIRFRCQTAKEVFAQNGFRGEILIDIGCGQGQVTHALREAGFTRAFGFDITPKRIEAISQRNGGYYFLSRAQNLPFGNGSVAGVTMYEVFEHLSRDDAIKMLQETNRVLKPGGLTILSTPNTLSLGHRLRMLFTNNNETTKFSRVDHPNEVNYLQLKEAFEKCRFQILELKGIGVIPGMWRMQKLFPLVSLQDWNIRLGFPSPKFASEILVVAQK